MMTEPRGIGAGLCRWAAENPSAVALEGSGPDAQALTFSELWHACASLAACLRESAAGMPENRHGMRPVALLLSEGVALALAELAVLMAGEKLVLCPLEPTDPRTRRMLENLAPSVVIAPADSDTAQILDGPKPLFLSWPALLHRARSRNPTPPSAWADPPDGECSHVIFTSGSTGRPKGCVCAHGTLRSFAAGWVAAIRLRPEDTVLCAS